MEKEIKISIMVIILGIPITTIGLIIGTVNIIDILSKYLSEYTMSSIWIAIGFLMFGLGLASIVILIRIISEHSEKSRYCINCGNAIS